MRKVCPLCLRPARACLCGCTARIESQVQLLVLQHPMEVGHAKNTARLLHLCIAGSRLEVGESFVPALLQQWLHQPWTESDGAAPVHTILLYPPSPIDPQLPVQAPPPLPANWLDHPQHLRLVLIDGTWRKSRKMLYLNPLLQQLPRWSLQDAAPGGYVIRKAQAPGQLSSFEAGALSLAQLQGWSQQHPSWLQLMLSFEAAMRNHQALQSQGQCHG